MRFSARQMRAQKNCPFMGFDLYDICVGRYPVAGSKKFVRVATKSNIIFKDCRVIFLTLCDELEPLLMAKKTAYFGRCERVWPFLI